MAFTEYDSDIQGIPHFRNVPTAWLDDLGRIAVLSGAIEHSAYHIADALRIKRPKNGRTDQFTKECEKHCHEAA